MTKSKDEQIEDLKQKIEDLEKKHEKEIEGLKFIYQILRHDLLNILTILKSSLNIFKETNDDQLLADMYSYIKKATKLIRTIRELESTYGKPNLLPYQIRKVITNVIKAYKSMNFEIEVDSYLYVIADNALSITIDNIVNNAIKHGRASKITIKAREEDKYFYLSIADNGCGIPEEIKTKIFEDGFKFGETGNTGIGLYIVKKLITRYGGEVTVQNNQPCGAIITLRLLKAK